ncbi:MAG: hypothetical protein K6F79_04995 [Saccharofermentans sp.]|nr:hypothetical protein [Saccharofermentans sp.]
MIKNFFKKVWGGIKKPFGFIKRKSEPAREFMKSGRTGAIIMEVLLASQCLTWIISSYTYDKYPWILMFIISCAMWVIIAELMSLLIKLVFAGGKRCRTYFIIALFSGTLNNVLVNQGESIPGAILMTFALALAADVLGRIIWAFVKTKRYKQVFAYIAIALCAAYLGFYAYFYHTDRFGDSRVEFYNSFAPEQRAQVQGFDTYLQNGNFEVVSLSYGPDESDDITTDTIDFTVYDSVNDRSGFSAFQDMFNDYDFSAVPVKGQIWYPQGQTNCPVFFMVHGNHDSYVPSYLGYEYLGEYLASNGYVVVSVDENIINGTDEGNDKRAILLLENMKTILGLSEEGGNQLSGLIDPDRIAIGGHSRGGEMVATAYLFNDLDAYPEDGNVEFDYHFNITSIVAIAPVVDQYRPLDYSVEIENVNYLLIHGSNDQDVSSMMGEKQYNNITFTEDADEFYFKSSVYILGANHGQFNSLWGRYDIGDTGPYGFLNTNNFLDEHDQKVIAMAYIRSFLDTTLGIDGTYSSLMYDIDSYRSYLPETVYVTNYEDSNSESIIDFNNTVDITGGDGTEVSVEGASTWTYEPYSRGFTNEGENYVLSLEWEEESSPQVQVLFDEIDISEGDISFAIADTCEDTEDIAEDFGYTVTLTDAEGNTVSVDSPVFVYHTLAVQLYKQDVLFGNYEYKPQLQTVTVSAEDFPDAGDFDFAHVTGIIITTDGSGEGSMIIDNLRYSG